LSLDAEQAQTSARSGAGRRAVAALTLTAAAVLASAAVAAPQTLSETGSSLMAPLFALWGPAYHARFSQVTLRTTSSSPGQGIDAAAAGPADIGASDAYLSPATLAKHAHLVNIPLAVAALMVVYPVLPAAGTIKAALASFTNTPASETISLVNGAGARAYPIVNYEYAIVNTAQRSATRARDLRAFLSWAITSGAGQLARVNFQPLPSSVVTLSGTQIATIKG
jgi:ABC-type phosphate transport system substrate-binding protein